MPNHPVAGAIIVVSVAVAAAIAVYESPQARQFAEDVRRRIAIALHSLGDEINPQSQEPRFNRPEDAEGFLQSSAEPGVDADEESRRRQREELMYWNAVHLEKMEKERKLAEERPLHRSRGLSFDDFLQEDQSAEKGTYVYKTGTDAHQDSEEGLRNRGGGVRGLNRSAIYANPFSDEHHIDFDEQRAIDASLMAPETSERCEENYETFSDLYSANEVSPPTRETTATIEQLIDVSDPVPDPPLSLPSPEMIRESYNFTNMSERTRNDSAYASIHAWADNTNNSFYSPLPTTPRAVSPQPQFQTIPKSPTFSDPDLSVPGDGDRTPTDSASLADSGEEIWAPRSGATSEADMMSVDGLGVSTQGSWTEVGSEVSENDIVHPMHN
ncbi:hypothetical protein BJ875DRAFT_372677 [Amylocarpus encephaloides]|uniref:Uncharacterized protein n=1 Tax=Amylocarpus encephaloides TaxID=45428 RepID=A0A9P8C8K7_9HELO|nr:hypothetical protein BJ875DRAFT_372677 [Amylocarpus encephaloides]